MECNQDTRLVSGMVVTGAPCVCLSAVERWWPRNGKRMRVVETFSSTVTYGPFTRDYIHPCDLTFSGKASRTLYASIQFSTPREKIHDRVRLRLFSRQLLQQEGDL